MLDDKFVGDRRPRPEHDLSVAAYPNQPAGWSDGAQDQPLLDLAVYWRLALKYRILVLGCFFGAIAIGAALTLLKIAERHPEVLLEVAA